jgi:hypothetical protein
MGACNTCHCIWLMDELLAEVIEGVGAVFVIGLLNQVDVGVHSKFDEAEMTVIQSLLDAPR